MRSTSVATAIAFSVVLGSVVAACGAENDDTTQPRDPTAPYASTVRPVTPQSDMGPPPQNMPGGGRGFDPPHTKGKP